MKTIYSYGVVICTLLILYGTLSSADIMSGTRIWSYDKMIHLLSFGIWAFVLQGRLLYEGLSVKKSTLYSFVIGAIFGVGIEILQLVLPINRAFEWLDIVYDFIGIIVFIGLANVVLSSTTTLRET